LGGDVDGDAAEVGVRVGVLDDGEVAVVDDVARRVAYREPGPASVVMAEPGGESGVHEQRMAGVPLQLGAPLDLLDDGSVEPDPDVEEEVAAVHRADPDVAHRAAGQRADERTGRLDGIARRADGAGEDVGRSAG